VTVFSLAGDTVVNDTLAGGWSPGSVPVSGLLPKTYYLIRISDSPSFDGPADYMSYFVTEDTEMPVVLDYTPADRAWLVGLGDPVDIEFSKPLNTQTVDSSSFYVLRRDSKVPGFISFGVTGDSLLSFAPLEPYWPAWTYTVVLTSRIQDNIGNCLDSMSWTFTTGTFATIGYEGGALRDGYAQLRLPRGTLQANEYLGMGRLPEEHLDIDTGLFPVGEAVDIVPIINLHREATLAFFVPREWVQDYGGLDRFGVYRYDVAQGHWELLGGSPGWFEHDLSGDGLISLPTEQYDSALAVSIHRLGRYGVFPRGSAAVSAVSDFDAGVSLYPRVINPRGGSGVYNSSLNISFSLIEPVDVVARIYSSSGRLVRTLDDAVSSAPGEKLLIWDGREAGGDFADDGLYILVVETGDERIQRTFVVMNR
jgi:hypothetical protein